MLYSAKVSLIVLLPTFVLPSHNLLTEFISRWRLGEILMHVFTARWQHWQGLCSMECSFQFCCRDTIVKTVATILRLPLTSLLTAAFSLVAVRPIRLNHMVDIIPHGLGSQL